MTEEGELPLWGKLHICHVIYIMHRVCALLAHPHKLACHIGNARESIWINALLHQNLVRSKHKRSLRSIPEYLSLWVTDEKLFMN